MSYFRTYILKLMYRIIVPLLYRDKKKRKTCLKKWITQAEKQYLKRYLYVIDDTKRQTKPCPNIIWICWLQGIENAPDIVKRCYGSVKKHCKNFEIRIIDSNNINSYIELPDYVWQKYKAEKITHIQFSDILRISLLSKHGGYWLDSTVFMTDSIPQIIQEADFFAFHVNSCHHKNNSWFLKASANDVIMTNMRNLMLEYWKHENRLIDYFLYHIFFDLMVENSKNIATKWNKIPCVYDDNCYDLEHNFFIPYDLKIWQELKQNTTIHKLSYKYKKDKPILGTFLENLLNNQLT